jgi:hypothetical protein
MEPIHSARGPRPQACTQYGEQTRPRNTQRARGPQVRCSLCGGDELDMRHAIHARDWCALSRAVKHLHTGQAKPGQAPRWLSAPRRGEHRLASHAEDFDAFPAGRARESVATTCMSLPLCGGCPASGPSSGPDLPRPSPCLATGIGRVCFCIQEPSSTATCSRAFRQRAAGDGSVSLNIHQRLRRNAY